MNAVLELLERDRAGTDPDACPPQQPYVLLVDDNPNNLLALQGILEGLEATLATADSGPAALRWLADHEAAAILLDVAMPELNGFETAKLIRLRPRSQHTPILFVTAVASGEMQRGTGYHLGAVDYLVKPLEAETVRSKVAVFVKLHQQKLDLQRAGAERKAAFEKLQQAEAEIRTLNAELEQRVQLRTAQLEASNKELQQAEAEIRTLNAELEQRVQLRTAQLEASNKELEAFSYSVSHDLRAPLRAIDGFSCILQEEHSSHLPPDALSALTEIRTGTQRMGQLIDDLLTFSRLERQDVCLQTIEPAELVEEALANLLPVVQGRPIDWCIGRLPPCAADRALLRQVFINLLDNAVKFSRGRAPARIEIGARAGDTPGEIVYFVKDNGVGFDMCYVHKLFCVFQRLHSATEFEGTGIGLALVQRIIHKHGGRVWGEGAVDQGATFSFSLPREVAS